MAEWCLASAYMHACDVYSQEMKDHVVAWDNKSNVARNNSLVIDGALSHVIS